MSPDYLITHSFPSSICPFSQTHKLTHENNLIKIFALNRSIFRNEISGSGMRNCFDLQFSRTPNWVFLNLDTTTLEIWGPASSHRQFDVEED